MLIVCIFYERLCEYKHNHLITKVLSIKFLKISFLKKSNHQNNLKLFAHDMLIIIRQYSSLLVVPFLLFTQQIS